MLVFSFEDLHASTGQLFTCEDGCPDVASGDMCTSHISDMLAS